MPLALILKDPGACGGICPPIHQEINARSVVHCNPHLLG